MTLITIRERHPPPQIKCPSTMEKQWYLDTPGYQKTSMPASAVIKAHI
jgi:hypothetical protein